MAQDQLFKELLQAFLPEFVDLFFPEVAARLDFSNVTYLDKEVFTDLPEGSQREPDVVAQLRTVDGEPELLLIHVEVQKERERAFKRRMYDYFHLLRWRRRLPVLPMALHLSRGTGGIAYEEYEEQLFGEWVARFRYRAVSLPDLLAEEYREHPNPLAPALAALMKRGRVSRPLHKALCLLGVARAPTDEARRSLLQSVVERQVSLSDHEEEEFEQLVAVGRMREVRQMISPYVERGMLIAKRDYILRVARRRYDRVPPALEARVRNTEIEAELDQLLDEVLTVGVEHWEP